MNQLHYGYSVYLSMNGFQTLRGIIESPLTVIKIKIIKKIITIISLFLLHFFFADAFVTLYM